MKVLQIDDSPQICEMYADMFTADQNTINSVNDGREGLELVIKNDYDLILLDIRMPEYSGIDFLKDLKEKRSSELKKIVVTSLLQFNETEIKELMDFGIHSVENKPSNFQQLKTLQKSLSVNKKIKSRDLRILVIDEQPRFTAVLSKFFHSQGLQAIVTNDSWEGLKLIQNEKFDVILLEINMPEFSGLKIIKTLATDEILQDQNIFILPTPFGHNTEIKELIMRDGINGFVPQTEDPNEILKTITNEIGFQASISTTTT